LAPSDAAGEHSPFVPDANDDPPAPAETDAAEATEETDETEATAATDEAAAAEHLARVDAALAALDDDSVRHAVGALSESSRTELAGTLQLPRATMHLGNALAPLLRRKLRSAAPPRQLSAAFALTEAVNEETVHALGARHDDPSREDLDTALPAVLEHHGAPLVTLMVAAYAASDAQCQAVMADLLATDERLTIGDPIDDGDAPTTPARTNDKPADDRARREDRKAHKAARRDAQQRERAAQQAAHAARKTAQRRAKRNG
jgi:hypothetical protein